MFITVPQRRHAERMMDVVHVDERGTKNYRGAEVNMIMGCAQWSISLFDFYLLP